MLLLRAAAHSRTTRILATLLMYGLGLLDFSIATIVLKILLRQLSCIYKFGSVWARLLVTGAVRDGTTSQGGFCTVSCSRSFQSLDLGREMMVLITS